jgi:SNF2 family DNA or RNA helicase
MSQKQILDVSPSTDPVPGLQEEGKCSIPPGSGYAGVKKITVRRRKPTTPGLTNCSGGGGVGGGLRVFDEYLAKSGLESKGYQQEGVSFCLQRESSASPNPRVFGGIIADEMGLGKTIVMIGLILANLALVKRTLIVVPVALISQWVAQLKKTVIDSGFKRDLTIAVYHGSSRRKIVNVSSSESTGGGWHLLPGTRSKTSATTRPIDIVITTYGSVAMEVPSSSVSKKKPILSVNSKPRLSLLTFGADRVIFDEAHHMRNKKNRIFRGAMRLLGHTTDAAVDASDASAAIAFSRTSRPRIWIVTGTPIQNKISDLKSLCYILGFLPCEVMHSEQQAFIREHYVLRRTKLSVGMICTGASTDAGEHGLLKSLEHSNSNVDWSNENELHLSREIHSRARNTEDRSERLKLYTRMRQMCVMPALINSQPGNGYGSSIDVELYNLPVERYKNALSHQSKINRLVDVVMRELSVDPTRKSLIFCHFRREMLQIRDVIRNRWLSSSSGDCDIDIIDGSVSGGRRNRILAASPQILILQIRTCSEGLNLQAYSDVYFVSPNWNPCVEDQAIARCYRMGQTSQVRVFRFYMTDFVGGGGGSDGGDSGSTVNAGEIGEEESITTLDNKCEATQERKRILCREFLDQERVSCL